MTAAPSVLPVPDVVIVGAVPPGSPPPVSWPRGSAATCSYWTGRRPPAVFPGTATTSATAYATFTA